MFMCMYGTAQFKLDTHMLHTRLCTIGFFKEFFETRQLLASLQYICMRESTRVINLLSCVPGYHLQVSSRS